jgi:hypothetical protein
MYWPYLMLNACLNVTYATITLVSCVLYIVMDETTKFISHMRHEPWFSVWEKPHSLVMGSTPTQTT